MKNTLKMGIVAVLMVALIGGYYFYLSHRTTKPAEEDVEVTELDKVIGKQLENKYPPTPREVIKFYNRIIECAYGDSCSEEQLGQLVSQARKLMDEELLAGNPEDEHKIKLLEDIAVYKDNKQKIIQTQVCNSDEVEFADIEDRKCAYVSASYFIKQGKGKFERTNENYLLRKDADGNWKILGYYLTGSEEEE